MTRPQQQTCTAVRVQCKQQGRGGGGDDGGDGYKKQNGRTMRKRSGHSDDDADCDRIFTMRAPPRCQRRHHHTPMKKKKKQTSSLRGVALLSKQALPSTMSKDQCARLRPHGGSGESILLAIQGHQRDAGYRMMQGGGGDSNLSCQLPGAGAKATA